MLELLLLGQAHLRVFRVRTQLTTCNPHMIQHQDTILRSNVLITCCSRFQETDNKLVWSKSEDAQWIGFKANSNNSKFLWPETFGWFTVVQEPQCSGQVEGVKLQSKHSSTSWLNLELYGYITIFKSHLWFQISNQRCYIICEPNQNPYCSSVSILWHWIE